MGKIRKKLFTPWVEKRGFTVFVSLSLKLKKEISKFETNLKKSP
jgi:hypothetical protein